jgi:hypothetical protein
MLINEEEKKQKERRERFQVHDICKERTDFREYHSLFPYLMENDITFFQYFRIAHKKFTFLLIPALDLPKPNTSGENT